jgi:hypothetical protein
LTNIRKELVLAFVQKYHPSSVSDLKRRLNQEGIRSTDSDLIEVVRELEAEGAITLQPFSIPGSFAGFLFNPDRAWWIYLIVISSALEALLVVANVQSGPGWIVRLLLGLGLLGLMPGYSTVQILFPGDRLPFLEQALLSIFLSVIVSISLGVALGAGYFFTGVSSVIALSVYTIAAVIIAGYRRYSLVRSSSTSRPGSGARSSR